MELPSLPLEKLGGWGYRTNGVLLTEHGPAILIAPLPERLADRQHVLTLVTSETHRDVLNKVGVCWNYAAHCLQIPLGSTLQRAWNANLVAGSNLPFGIQVTAPEIQERDAWRRSIAQGQFPVSEYGNFLVHDITDHIPAIVTLDYAFAKSLQSRMAFLIALDDRLTTACPAGPRDLIRKLITFHEQQFEMGSVQISIGLGHVPSEPERAERNIIKVYERLQRWPALLGISDDGSKGDLQFLCDGIRERFQQAEGWLKDTKESFDQALGLTSWNEFSTRHIAPANLTRRQIARLRADSRT